MAENDMLRRYLDAGIAFTQMTQKRAEEIVRDLVKAGEVQTEQAQQVAQELFDRSRQNTERLLDLVRNEIKSQISNLNLATRDDVERLVRRLTGGTATKAPARKATAKKATAKKATAKKSAAKKAPAKRAAAKKTTAKKSTAKKASGAAKKSS